MSSPTTDYASVSMGLRPSRVVVVFDGVHDWSYWARKALYLAELRWGGSGFAVVPHRGGEVDPVLLAACRAYDPDHVVTMSATIGEVENIQPGWFQVQGDDGTIVGEPDRQRLLESARDTDAGPLGTDREARDQVAAACSIYRRRDDDGGWHDLKSMLDAPQHGDIPEIASIPGAPGGVMLSSPSTWGGVLGVATASRAGVLELPSPQASEVTLGDDDLSAVVDWLLDGRGHDLPRELLHSPTVVGGVLTEQTMRSCERAEVGLAPIVDAGTRVARLLVVGDTPEDFALARLWRLTFGQGYWLPSVLGLNHEAMPRSLRPAASRIAHEAQQAGGSLLMTSLSRSAEQLVSDRDLLHLRAEGGDPRRAARSEIVVGAALPWSQSGRTYLAVKDQFDDKLAMPVRVHPNGTREMAAPLPPPVLRDPTLAAADLRWHVDVSWEDEQGVRERGLPSTEVFAPDTSPWLRWGRRSRYGTSYPAERYDLVLAGIQPENRLARVKLRDLCLADWVRAKCSEHGLTVQLSPAGHRSAQLGRMMGGRRAFVRFFSGPFLPAINAMRPTASSTTTAYPQHDGVRLAATTGCLTFAGLQARVSGLSAEHLRDELDDALQSGVLRRGLILRCAFCEELQFLTIERIGQRWTCNRCEASNNLNRTAWRYPIDEPSWFYDLHPVAHRMLAEHGEVPALLATHLAAERGPQSQPLADIDEVELVLAGTKQVELDYIGYTNDTLTIAECKSTDNLGNGKKEQVHRDVAKKCQAAAWLRANRIIYATTAPTWNQRTRQTIETAVRQYKWVSTDQPPQLQFITNLGRPPGDEALQSS